MLVKNVVLALLSLAMVAEASVIDRSSPFGRALERRQAKKQGASASAARQSQAAQAKSSQSGSSTEHSGASNTGSDSASLCLNANAVQTGSQITGQVNGVPAEGQVNSLT